MTTADEEAAKAATKRDSVWELDTPVAHIKLDFRNKEVPLSVVVAVLKQTATTLESYGRFGAWEP